MEMEGKGRPEEAGKLFLQAWNQAADDFEKFMTAHLVAQRQEAARGKVEWLETALKFALRTNDEAVKAAFPPLYSDLAKCYEELDDPDNAKRYSELAKSYADEPSDAGPFYHGTRADLDTGDLLTAGGTSNYTSGLMMNHIYFTALVNGAGLAAALAKGDGRERVYIVEPTGSFENDPNVTNKKFPGNPTRSYRSTSPLRVIGEVTDWARQTPERVDQWRERLANSKGEIIN
jgi:rifampin ADP-ribosylating transferase